MWMQPYFKAKKFCFQQVNIYSRPLEEYVSWSYLVSEAQMCNDSWTAPTILGQHFLSIYLLFDPFHLSWSCWSLWRFVIRNLLLASPVNRCHIVGLCRCQDPGTLSVTELCEPPAVPTDSKAGDWGQKFSSAPPPSPLNGSPLGSLKGSFISLLVIECKQEVGWMGYVADRMGCGVFMMLVENQGPLQSGHHLKIPAFMCRLQWDVKIYS